MVFKHKFIGFVLWSYGHTEVYGYTEEEDVLQIQRLHPSFLSYAVSSDFKKGGTYMLGALASLSKNANF